MGTAATLKVQMVLLIAINACLGFYKMIKTQIKILLNIIYRVYISGLK